MDKRKRAKKTEVEQREQTVLDIFVAADGALDVHTVASKTGWEYVDTGSTMRGLERKALIRREGKSGKRILWSITEAGMSRAAGDEQEAVASEPTPRVEALPAVSINTLLQQLHMGRQLEVVGFHMTMDDATPFIDLKAETGEVVTVSLVDSAAA